MHPTRSIDLHPEALAYRIDMGRTLAVVVTIGLALVISVSLAVAGAVAQLQSGRVELSRARPRRLRVWNSALRIGLWTQMGCGGQAAVRAVAP